MIFTNVIVVGFNLITEVSFILAFVLYGEVTTHLFNMSQKVYRNDLKSQIVKMHQKGEARSVITKLFDIRKSVVSLIIKRYTERGTTVRPVRSGRPRSTTRREDILITRQCQSNPFLSATKIKAELGLHIRSRTIQRRLVAKGLYSRRPAKKPLLTKKQQINRLNFAREHLN